MLIAPYQYLLFDLDNTILNFSEASRVSLRSFANILKIEYNQDFLDVYHQINHEVWTEFENGIIDSIVLRRKRFELTAEYYGRKVDGLLVNRRYIKGIIDQVIFMNGAEQILESTISTHKLSLITNGLKEAQRPRLKTANIDHYFEHIIVSDEIGLAKPDYKYFEHSWELIGKPTKSAVLVIGDNPNSDIIGGKNFGFDTCLYDPSNKHTKHEATHKITHLKELVTVTK